MSENVFVRGESNSSFEAMTKEEILAAIVQAVEGGTVGDIDTGFVTTIKEQNKGQGLMFWVGTSAEYEALEIKPNNVLYIKTDDTSATDINNNFTAINTQLSSLNEEIAAIPHGIDFDDTGAAVTIAANTTEANAELAISTKFPLDAIPIVTVYEDVVTANTNVKYKAKMYETEFWGDQVLAVDVYVWNEGSASASVRAKIVALRVEA